MVKLFNQLSKKDQELIHLAEKVMVHGYDPYSLFFVGCALLTTKGNIYTGANLSTPAYLGLCAERSAIGSAITKGEYSFRKIALIAKSDYYDVTELSGPCGICRQIIWEFSELINKDITILSSDTRKKNVLVTSIRKLHPHGFGPRLCGKNIDKYL
ncbi:cytidine deaminase [Patescibacteria group bacterium]|nr:cytidine deaminase [Patescibacteria group bacterium]